MNKALRPLVEGVPTRELKVEYSLRFSNHSPPFGHLKLPLPKDPRPLLKGFPTRELAVEHS